MNNAAVSEKSKKMRITRKGHNGIMFSGRDIAQGCEISNNKLRGTPVFSVLST